MTAIDALINRVSVNLLEDPAPSAEQLDLIIRAGLRACDHRNLRPWRYLIIRDDARHAFGALMVKAMEANRGSSLESELREKIAQKPFRAPLIIAVVANVKSDPKVPKIEQVMSAAASAQMMVTAAHVLEVGAMWRSGSIMFEPTMKEGLGLGTDDEIVGFLYLGTPVAVKEVPQLDPAVFTSVWSG